MHTNILLTLSTLTALSSNAAAQLPLNGLNGLGGLDSPGIPSSTPIPTLTKRPAKPTTLPSQASTLPVPALNARDGSDTERAPELGNLLGGILIPRSTPGEDLQSPGEGGEYSLAEISDTLGGLAGGLYVDSQESPEGGLSGDDASSGVLGGVVGE
ncbi:hypothetical protein PENNAL_c0018G02393 [Penicillium nalgiovense]|uniref:Uncharacterized protein n=1 Tax=Penicillium nalgiovense TaxID=60175 RepID=A0A1V6YLC7_PENNA|nr:hypothetical protein PENNAL_c0018G02393 [Penicillium nalgiovense]